MNELVQEVAAPDEQPVEIRHGYIDEAGNEVPDKVTKEDKA